MRIQPNIVAHATRIATKSPVKRGRVGAVLFTSQGSILASACNVSFYGDKTRFTIHAEEFLLAKIARTKILLREPQRVAILVVRVSPDSDSIRMAKPCEKCQRLLAESGIPVYYSDASGEIRRL